MTIKPEEDSDRYAREALHWLIALQEEPDDYALQVRFKVWRAADINNEKAWTEAVKVWDVLGDVPSAQTSRSSQPGSSRQGQKSTPIQQNLNLEYLTSRHAKTASQAQGVIFGRSGRHLITGISATVVATCFLFFFLPMVNIWLSSDYSTGTAEWREVRLVDGTIVSLGANSAIEIAYEPNRRRVRLLAGEAFFEVKPDRARPFMVDAGEVKARVLGTAFNVRLMSEGARIAVAHGSVAISYPKTRQKIGAPLKAGDWARVSWNGVVKRGATTPGLVAAWRTGNFIVKDETIGDVVDELRRYYPGVVIVMGAGLSDKRITGVYKLKDPVSALQAVAEAHGAITRQIGSRIMVMSRF